MCGRVDPAGFKIETHCLGDVAIECLLRGDWIMAAQQILRYRGRTLRGRTEHGHDGRTQLREQRAQPAGAYARLVFLQQGIVGRFLVAPALGHLAVQFQDLLQVWLEHLEFGTFPRLAPGFVRQRADALEFFHQPRRHFDRPVVQPPPLADVRGFIRPGVEPVLFAGGNQIANFPGRESAVDQAAETGELSGAVGQGLGRHVRSLVPSEQSRRAGEQGGFAGALHKSPIGHEGFRHGDGS